MGLLLRCGEKSPAHTGHGGYLHLEDNEAVKESVTATVWESDTNPETQVLQVSEEAMGNKKQQQMLTDQESKHGQVDLASGM